MIEIVIITVIFSSAQDSMKDISSLIETVKNNLFKGIPEESISDKSFSGGNTNNADTVKLNNLKEKLKVTREEYKFQKEVRDDK